MVPVKQAGTMIQCRTGKHLAAQAGYGKRLVAARSGAGNQVQRLGSTARSRAGN